MYRRDVGILLLAIFAVYWSLQHEGSFTYRKAFYYDIPRDDRFIQEEHRLPPAVVVRHC
jgi:hypothetical protein